MSRSRKKMSVYAEIAAEIQDKIERGFFKRGERIFSKSEICIKYGISGMTAQKVHDELERLGVAYKVRGSGVFACKQPTRLARTESKPLNPVEQIVFFADKATFTKKGNFDAVIFNGLQKRAFDLGLNIRTELYSPGTTASYTIADDEGVIVPYSSGCEWLLPMMERKRVRRILVNNYFSEAYCVLNDNYSGMSQIIDHLESIGCRKIFLGTKHFNSLGIANLSERNYAFENECSRRGIEHRTITSGSFNELLKLIKGPAAPDAVVFSSDGPALKLRDMLAKSKSKKIPAIAGFDGWNDGDPVNDIITVKVDYEGLGAAAVDLMLNNTLEDWCIPDVTRVPCSLLVPGN